MTDKTMTFTARSAYDPEKTTTFTLQNGSAAVEFGAKLLQQTEEAIKRIDLDEAGALQNMAKPTIFASLQKLMEPFPVQDFSAELEGESLQVQAWVRKGGLRLAPIIFRWEHVDNPAGAAAFVTELRRRQAQADNTNRFPGAFDYWAFWLLAGLAAVIIPILFWRQRHYAKA